MKTTFTCKMVRKHHKGPSHRTRNPDKLANEAEILERKILQEQKANIDAKNINS